MIRYILKIIRPEMIFAVMVREYKRIGSDIAVITLFLGVQILYPIIYPLGFYGGHANVRELPVAVVDLDKSAASRQFISMADANENIEVRYRQESLSEAVSLFNSGKASGIIVIPGEFSRNIYNAEQAAVSVYCDASLFYIYKQVLLGVKTTAGYMSAGVQIKRLTAKGMSSAEAARRRDPLPLISYPLYNPSSSYMDYLLPGVLLMILQQTLIIGIGTLAGISRESGDLSQEREQISQYGLLRFIIGRASAYLSIFILHSFYFFTAVFKFHSLPMKTGILSLMLFTLPFLTASVFLGMSLSVFFQKRESALMIMLFSTIPLFLLSGYSWPLFCMPAPLQIISQIIPSTPGLAGYTRMTSMGATFSDVLPEWLSLFSLSLVYFLTTYFLFRRLYKAS